MAKPQSENEQVDELLGDNKSASATLAKQEEAKKVRKYRRFAELHFMCYSSGEFKRKSLKEKAQLEHDELEKEIKTWKGDKPKKSKTVFIASGEENQKIVQGFAAPKTIVDIFKNAGKYKAYF